MNSRGFLRGERNLTLKRVCTPPPHPAMRKTRHKCAATAERVSRDSWLCEGSSGIPTPPLTPRSPHSPDNTELITLHTHPAAWSHGHSRQDGICPADTFICAREAARCRPDKLIGYSEYFLVARSAVWLQESIEGDQKEGSFFLEITENTKSKHESSFDWVITLQTSESAI